MKPTAWALVIVCLIVAAVQPLRDAEVRDREHRSMHTFSSDGHTCTAYAVGTHSIITASHCFSSLDILVDDVEVGVHEIITDGQDHALFLLDGVEFKDYVPLVISDTIVGERIRTFGNPLAVELTNQYREGYRSGTHVKGAYVCQIFVIPSVPGDSGALFFSDSGSIVGEQSLQNGMFACSFPIQFTQEQIDRAESY